MKEITSGLGIIPKGFITKKNGDESHSRIEPGELTLLLFKVFWKDLEYNLMSCEAELNRVAIPTVIVDNFYIFSLRKDGRSTKFMLRMPCKLPHKRTPTAQ